MAGISGRPPVGFNYFKIVDSDSVSITKSGSSESANTQVAHGLSEIPTIVPFLSTDAFLTDNFLPLPQLRISTDSWPTISNGLVLYHAFVTVDVQNIYFEVQTPNITDNTYYTFASENTFYYYIIEESAQTT